MEWEYTIDGEKYYGATGSRDVLMIVASESLVGPDIVQRKRGCLTQQDRDKLTSEGIPQECWEDDGRIMEARFQKDQMTAVSEILYMKSSEYVLKRIDKLLQNTTKPIVFIHYIGPGKRDTGDWCFVDGFITFDDVLKLYMKHFHGKDKNLSITSNCSYSGHWVTACREFLDREGVQPCAHSGRQKGVLLRMKASCKPNEIGYSLYYSTRVQGNDRNGELYYTFDRAVEPDQHSIQVYSNHVTCGKIPIDEECKLLPDYTYQREYESKRVYLVRFTDRGCPAWHYVLLVDDEETICIFKEKIRGENKGTQNITVSDYGQVLKSGWGKEPPKEVKDWQTRTYRGVMPEEQN